MEKMKRRWMIRILWAIGILWVTICIFTVLSEAGAEETENREPVWILCQENSYVNIRARPSGRSMQEGMAWCGDRLETDGRQKNGFLHIYAPIEAGEGWVSLGYLVWEEPKPLHGETWEISSRGRVAARRAIDGNRRKWLKYGDRLKVYWMSGEWSCTSQGFVKTEFLRRAEE